MDIFLSGSSGRVYGESQCTWNASSSVSTFGLFSWWMFWCVWRRLSQGCALSLAHSQSGGPIGALLRSKGSGHLASPGRKLVESQCETTPWDCSPILPGSRMAGPPESSTSLSWITNLEAIPRDLPRFLWLNIVLAVMRWSMNLMPTEMSWWGWGLK